MSREASASRADRNDYVDLLRGASIVAVVVGHWLLTAIQYRAGEFDGFDAITYVSWGSWVTLVLQVVPVFFLVGGYANALSWSRRRAAGGSWADWLRLRMRRLLVPTSTYLAVVTVAVAVAEDAGVSANNLYQAGWALAFQLWFLAAYAVLLVATPILHAAHRRWGVAIPVVMGAVAVAISAVVAQWHWHLIGWANYVLVWGVFHQLGFAWRDGAFTGRRWRAVALAVASAGADWRWLAPGFPAVETQPPSNAIPVASLLREADAALPAAAACGVSWRSSRRMAAIAVSPGEVATASRAMARRPSRLPGSRPNTGSVARRWRACSQAWRRTRQAKPALPASSRASA